MRYHFVCRTKHCNFTCEISMPMADMNGPDQYPDCENGHGKMGKIYSREVLSEAHRNKGLFPQIDENMGHEPVYVESQQHRRRLMKERGLHDREPTDGARSRARSARRKTFYMGR